MGRLAGIPSPVNTGGLPGTAPEFYMHRLHRYTSPLRYTPLKRCLLTHSVSAQKTRAFLFLLGKSQSSSRQPDLIRENVHENIYESMTSCCSTRPLKQSLQAHWAHFQDILGTLSQETWQV